MTACFRIIRNQRRLQVVNMKDRRELLLLLETGDGLIIDWVAIKRVTCGHFDKRYKWTMSKLHIP